MSTMTLEQVRDELRATADHADSGYDKAWAIRLADAIDAYLRERESAKAGVTDEMVDIATAAYMHANDELPRNRPVEDLMRAALEAVAPMLASARVPDGWQLVPKKATGEMQSAGHSAYMAAPHMNCFGTVWKAMLAAAPKTEKE